MNKQFTKKIANKHSERCNISIIRKMKIKSLPILKTVKNSKLTIFNGKIISYI